MRTILSRDDTRQWKDVLDQFGLELDEVDVILALLSIALALQALSAINILITTAREFGTVLTLHKWLTSTQPAIPTKRTLFLSKYPTRSSR